MKYISKKVISIGLPLVQTFSESLRNIPDGTLVAFTTLVLNQSTPLSLFASSYKNVTITTRLTENKSSSKFGKRFFGIIYLKKLIYRKKSLNVSRAPFGAY